MVSLLRANFFVFLFITAPFNREGRLRDTDSSGDHAISPTHCTTIRLLGRKDQRSSDTAWAERDLGHGRPAPFASVFAGETSKNRSQAGSMAVVAASRARATPAAPVSSV